MHVLVAPDKFNGSLRASEVAAHVAAGLRAAAPDLDVVQLPVADGGDGTLAAAGAGYRLVPVRVSGPTGTVVDTAFAVRDGVAVVELADACGLHRRSLLSREELAAAGIAAAYPLAEIEPDPARSMAMAGPLLEQVACRLAEESLR